MVDRPSNLETRLRAYGDALERIKARVCGEAFPNWENTPNTTYSRGVIADICDMVLRNKQEQSETNEPVGAQISGGRCWHCHNQIMVAPELGCPTCGREQDLRVLYFGQPPKVT